MIRCKQKYCKYCIKPVFDLGANFAWGYCCVSKHIILDTLKKDETKKWETQIFLCDCYTPRRRKIKY